MGNAPRPTSNTPALQPAPRPTSNTPAPSINTTINAGLLTGDQRSADALADLLPRTVNKNIADIQSRSRQPRNTLQTKHRQMQIDAGPLAAEVLQLLSNQQAETNGAMLALTTALATFVRLTDYGTAQRSVPGCMRRAMVEAIDSVTAVNCGSGALELMRKLLQTPTLDHTPRPPDPGSHIKIVAANDPVLAIAA